MLLHRNASGAAEAGIDGLICTRYTLDVCVVCGHERIHTAREETTCTDCGGSARRSAALFRGPLRAAAVAAVSSSPSGSGN